MFNLSKHKTSIKTEIMAGIITFLTMAYIIVVNPVILGDAGVPLNKHLQQPLSLLLSEHYLWRSLQTYQSQLHQVWD